MKLRKNRTKFLKELYLHNLKKAMIGTWEDWAGFCTPVTFLSGRMGWRLKGRNYAHNHAHLRRNYGH